MELNTLTLTQTIEKLKKKEITHYDLYASLTSVVQEKNPSLNVFLTWKGTVPVNISALLDKPLAGVPLAIKDNFLTKDFETTASSNVLKGFKPPYESTVTQKLRDAGAVVFGKTNMDAWAHGSSTETSDFGTTKNPRNTNYSPGGSSGGSGAAVAADMCIAAIGSETAGSIRLPAAWCGIVGLKPTYGRVSRAGVVAMGSSLDSPGPMTKTVQDSAFLLELIAGKDKYDSTTGSHIVENYTNNLNKGVKGMKVGIVYMDHPKLKGTVVDTAVRKAAKVLEELGAHVEEVPLSSTLQKGKVLTPDYAIGVYTVVQRGEVSSNLARYDGVRYGNDRSTFGDEAKRRIMLGTFTLSKGYADKYYVRAQQVRSLYIRNFHDLFEKYDVLLSTPTPGYALPIGSSADNPMFGELMDLLVEPSSLSGICGISVPCWHDTETNLYLGLNVMGNQWKEENILRVAYAFEQATDWNPWIKKEKHG